MSAYETSVTIPSFAGINQAGDGYNQSMRYARIMENVNVSGGSFSPMREGVRMEQTLDGPIGTLAYLYRRYNSTGPNTILMAISEGKVFTKALDGDDDWVQQYPGENQDPLQESDCDWLTYEINERGGQSLPAPVDVLLFTNAKDGMFCLYGDTLAVEHVQITTDPVEKPDEDIKFGVIARYNERIWGSGIEGDPDKLMYSVPYDPFDWRQNEEIPEDGAGDILQPSWDGDSFVALRQYGSNLLAIKRNAIWRIYGTNPGEFVIQQQFGIGTIEENTVAVSDDYIYMLGAKGIVRYDGSSVAPFQQDVVKDLMETQVNLAAMDQCVAAMRNGVYCLALPVNGSTFCNAILEYNTREYSFALRTDINVESFLQINERLFYTSATEPGRVIELRDDVGVPLPCLWESGYQDLGVKSSTKSAFLLYFVVEAEAPFELYLSIRTEKKVKEKVVMVKPGKTMRVHLNNQGRVFRLELKSYTSIPYTIAGGFKIDLELDPD